MTHDARRPLTEEERARIQAARDRGDRCARCGRFFDDGEPVWIERLSVGPGYDPTRAVYWRAPVGRECASPQAFRDACGADPLRCPVCGRPFYRPSRPARSLGCCSRYCSNRVSKARLKGVGR